MTGLDVQVQQANSTAPGSFGEFHLHGGLKREGGVADASAARLKSDNCRPSALGASGRNVRPGGARNNVENLLRGALQGHPVGAPAADQSLVVAGRNLPADEDENDAAMFLVLSDVYDAVERGDGENREDD